MSMCDLQRLRAFARGEIDENAFSELQSADEPFELEDEEFMSECMAIAAPLYIQAELMDESMEELEDAVNETYARLQNYMVGQGIISEATVTVKKGQSATIMSKQAQINRLEKIYTLMLARKANCKEYKKFKIGAQLKKNNMALMVKRFGNKAKKLAKQAWNKMAKNPKVGATIDAKKKKR